MNFKSTLLLLATSANLSLSVEGALLAYYPFDGDFTDASGNGNDLSVGPGMPTVTTTPGEHVLGGGALDLDSTTGNQAYLNLASPISFGAADAWSVVFWARHRPGNDGRTGMIVGDLTASNFIWIPRDGAVAGLRFRNGSSGNADYTTPPDGVEPAGVYHHYAVVADGAGKVEVFYDNIPLGSTSIATNFEVTSVGQAFNQATQSMNGQIDELYLYNEAIDVAKINELFGAASGPDTTPPTLDPANISDNRGGGPVEEQTLVTYTLSFSEDMDSGTIDAADFGNAGSASIAIDAITESSPGVFQIAVLPTSPGTLQLQILPMAVLKDSAGNVLDTDSAILDQTVITVEVATGPPVGVSRLRVYLLGGQSNAAGRGDSSGLPTSPVNLQLAQDDVDFYDGAPLTTLRPRSQFGPEITLGRRLSDSIGIPGDTRLAILKYGVGGTSLKTDWKSGGDATTAGDGPRYVSFQQVVADGLGALGTAYPGATIEIEGMLWVQGEKDARDLNHGEYETNLNHFIADVRETYGADLPFVVMRLASGQTNLPAAGLDGVRAAQTAVAAADPRVPLVDSDGFSLQSDALHFDALGQQQLGEASAASFLELLPFTNPPDFELLGNGDFKIGIDDAFPDFLYRLETNSSLREEGWTELDSTVATGSSVFFTVAPLAGEEHRFFRLKRSLAP